MTLPDPGKSYAQKRDALEHYFDRTAADAWRALTSDEKVSKIRATVRAGRDDMRAAILATLGDDLSGAQLLDAGCGTGALAVAAAERGAAVTAIDVSPTMIEIARERTAMAVPAGATAGPGEIAFSAGDMSAAPDGPFTHVVAMDSLIHYELPDIIEALSAWAPRVTGSIVFTIAPGTPMLMAMHAVGGLFPRGDRAPAIAPVPPARLLKAIAATPALKDFTPGRTLRVSRGFYKSQLMELVKR
ncbi:magnesium protoporphyrin IX methyltransferase [Acuticoccus sp. MNP-M23]|uniref:magnesium protoporphyrin IX methyltransferase n=1 Tax=Acuticoccus sp. MNP-M23 TaxID=3072793 RepID=UPI0028149723|nr:magnesium protoporphyrin IX methyltransferase [Acuticoccus sp. MNP-M23]WMS42703.1 magnesium protoporphyrin IX methyltransferase [Acuticoccus sp. MNP-M23]